MKKNELECKNCLMAKNKGNDTLLCTVDWVLISIDKKVKSCPCYKLKI